MEDITKSAVAKRKASEAASRRFQAAEWLESIVGPINLSTHPTENEFLFRLRNGLILCNAMNKVNPGAICKVVESHPSLQTLNHEFQPLPAYQYFENVKNFLNAIAELKLPGFEASDLEKDSMETSSASKIVDCILALKQYHESKKKDKSSCSGERSTNVEDIFLHQLAERMAESKENINYENLISSSDRDEFMFSFSKIMLSCLEPNLENQALKKSQCIKKGSCDHNRALQLQQTQLAELKFMLMNTKREFDSFQMYLQRNLKDLEIYVREIISAAKGYHNVVKENRVLFNMVQDLKGNIRIYCRIRPSSTSTSNNVVHLSQEEGTMAITDPSNLIKERKFFQFDKVFGPSSTQDNVFMDIQPLIRSVVDGFNVCIFAYGQTGSGKTYTMSGPSGINYRALNDLFHLSNERQQTGRARYEIFVQMVEIYNEQVRDLLAGAGSSPRVEIRRSTGDWNLSLPDATLHTVTSTRDVVSLMRIGETNRSMGCTAMNNRSSRSHSIVTVHVHGKEATGSMLNSSLHLVDLAGSERVDKSEATGERLREAQYINKSLSSLGDVISALANKSPFVPYRNSKLTLLLQDALGGSAKTLMFAHVSPESDSYAETMSTLKFAQRVSAVELGAARANREGLEVVQLREEVEVLKKTLADHKKTMVSPTRIRRLSLECPKADSKKVLHFGEIKDTAVRTPKRDPPAKEFIPASDRIRRSLRSIGKLINGSEKRGQEYGDCMKSPNPRRQSLAGVGSSVKSPMSLRSQGCRTPPSKKWL